jgi:hypothetical protein
MHVNQSILPGFPLIESPLFPSLLENCELDEADRAVAVQLNRNGFAVIEFPDPEIDQRIGRIKANLSPKFGITPGDRESVVRCSSRRLQDAWRFDEDVKAIAVNEAILQLLSRLYGRKAFPFQTLNFPVGTQQAAHTDAVHFSSVPERFMCGVWLAMEDIGPDAGPLFYIPGSHRWPVMSNLLIGREGWGTTLNSAQNPFAKAWRSMIAATGAGEEVFLARKRQALIWCANLLHGGSAVHDPGLTRWSQVTHYYFDDCTYYTPAYSDEPLGRLALRNIVDIADGQPKPNLYLGQPVKRSVLRPDKSLKRWLGRRFRSARSD